MFDKKINHLAQSFTGPFGAVCKCYKMHSSLKGVLFGELVYKCPSHAMEDWAGGPLTPFY